MATEFSKTFTARARVLRTFSPSAPIAQRDLFAGRTEQLQRVLQVIFTAGRHIMLYGERGVGKTSLARVLMELAQDTTTSAFVTCDSTDDFKSIWLKVF
jgi:MoxR-like ATPase